MVSQLQFWIDIASVLISCAAILANIVGIFLLRKIRSPESNQVFLLLHLSSADIIITVSILIVRLGDYIALGQLENIISALRVAIYITWYLIMYAITLDRFFGINFPLRYRQQQGIRLAVKLVWVFGGLSGIVDYVIQYIYPETTYALYLWNTLDVAYIVIMAITYASIFFKMYRSNNNQENPAQRNTTSNQHQFFKVITMILMAFVFLELIPSTVYTVAGHVYSDAVECITYAVVRPLFLLNLLADPLIYVFFQPRVKQLLYQMIQPLLCVRKHRVYSFTNTSLRHQTEQIETVV